MSVGCDSRGTVLFTAYYTPIFEASDELWHYPVVQYIAAGHGLPVQTPVDRPGLWKQQASQPPLYYALAALLTAWIDTSDLTRTLRPNPHAAVGMVTPDGNINLVAHDPAREAWPWSGTVLAVHLARLLSVAMGAATVYLTYRLGQEVFPDRPEVALGAAAITALTPMFIFISGSVNNDNLAILLCSLALLIVLRQSCAWQADEKRLMLGWLVLGVVIGLATLTKFSGVGLLAPAALAGMWVAWQRGLTLKRRAESASPLKPVRIASMDWRHLFAASLAIGVPVLALTGWWFWRNQQLYGDLLGFKMFTPYFSRPIPADLAQIWSERSSFLYGYWGNFGGLNLPIPSWAFALFNALLVLSAIGLIISLLRLALRPSLFDRRSSLAAFVIAFWGLIVFISWLTWTRTTWSSQGRLVFYALPSYAILMAAGLAAWLPRRLAAYTLGGVGVGMALFSAAMPFTVIAPAYARPPQLAAAQIAGIPHRADVTFGDALVLLGYDAPTAGASAQPGDSISITLYWQALEPLDRNYSIFLHLLDENDIEVQAQDKGQAYPGRGNLPTTTLAPGQTWAETWIMPVRATAYAPARLTWELGLFDVISGARLRAADKSGLSLGDNVRFVQIELRRPTGSLYDPVSY
jgi:4-amino-4-deoxy-L-arabinose transferase-like glycosyltransferase